MDTKQSLGFAGSVILFIGVFTPIVSVPIVGSVTYFNNRQGYGIFIFALAIASAFLTLGKAYGWLWFTGIAALGIVGYTFSRLLIGLQGAQSQMNRELADNPFRGLADVAMQSIQLQWGWATEVGTHLVNRRVGMS